MNRRKLLAFFTVGAAIAAPTALLAKSAHETLEDTGDRTAIKDGDMVVVSVPSVLTKEQAENLRETCREKFKQELGINVGVIVVAGGVQLSVIPRA